LLQPLSTQLASCSRLRVHLSFLATPHPLPGLSIAFLAVEEHQHAPCRRHDGDGIRDQPLARAAGTTRHARRVYCMCCVHIKRWLPVRRCLARLHGWPLCPPTPSTGDGHLLALTSHAYNSRSLRAQAPSMTGAVFNAMPCRVFALSYFIASNQRRGALASPSRLTRRTPPVRPTRWTHSSQYPRSH
jgi:hypothetical protein